jgi:hypothetical protein
MAMEYKRSLSAIDKRRYERKLVVVYEGSGIEVLDPYEIPESRWKDDISIWPPVHYFHLTDYLIDTPDPITREKQKPTKACSLAGL